MDQARLSCFLISELHSVLGSFHCAAMQRQPHPKQLTDMALAALEEIAARCHLAPQPRSRSLALVLAFLASRCGETSNRASFDQFWRAIVKAETNTRWQTANGALNGIYLALGEQRNLTVTSTFEGEARTGSPLLQIS